MPSDNVAKQFSSAKDAIEIKPAHNQLIKIGLGESITMEAWLRIDNLKGGAMPYLIGRGRDGNETTQNYALRLKGDGSDARLGFLFSSESDADNGAGEFHRWWSSATFSTEGWHHVALVYTFGKGDSLRAYIDGQPTDGTWDFGGKTDRAPVVKADSNLTIGTGYLKDQGQTFHGWLDDVRIYREAVSDEVLKSRFVFVPPPAQITQAMLQPGKVLVQISEDGVAAKNEWPNWPEVTETYSAPAFGFSEWPQKYISTGVRADRANPAHFRAAAMVDIPKGKHRLLLRGRGASRLTIDGKQLLETPFPTGDTGGHGHVASQDDYLDLGPDFRFVPPGNRESWVEFESKGGEQFVILESLIGGEVGS